MPERLDANIQHRFGRIDNAFSLDVSFQIDHWPAVLFGPSGAGKSSVLRILAGLERTDSSRILLGSKVLGPDRRDGTVQLVAQRPALFPHLTVAQNVAFGLARLRSGERSSRVREMLLLLGAEDLADRMPIRLSGGERQRVAIARALAPRPKMLLLDEAFAGLDSGAKQEIIGQLTGLLRERDVAALYVTHEVSEAFALDAEVVVLEQGRVVTQGPAHQALATERDRLLAAISQPAPAR
jgi:molybdate transport system ATP-binding protein